VFIRLSKKSGGILIQQQKTLGVLQEVKPYEIFIILTPVVVSNRTLIERNDAFDETCTLCGGEFNIYKPCKCGQSRVLQKTPDNDS